MIDLIFDTETTGDWGKLGLVQLAALLVDGPKVLHTASFIVHQDADIVPEAEKLHGISKEVSQKFGFSVSVALAVFQKMAKMADNFVAHNAQFDLRVINKAYEVINAKDARPDLPVICTMKSSTKTCGLLNVKGNAKNPTLQEAHLHFLGENFEEAHNALADTQACHRILVELRQQNIPLVNPQNEAV